MFAEIRRGRVRASDAARGRRLVARIVAVALCAGFLAGTSAESSVPSSPVFPSLQPASGYVRLLNTHGTWWLIDPSGRPTVSVGVDDVSYTGDLIRGTSTAPYLAAVERQYHTRAAWEQSVVGRLRQWGFNTLGAWSEGSLEPVVPYTVMLDFAARAGARWWGSPADVFDRKFEATARAIAAQEASPRATDPMLVGYFSDNELWWGGDWRNPTTMLAAYLAFPPAAPGRGAAIAFLRARYGTIARLNRAWATAAPDFAHASAPAAGRAYRSDAAAFLGVVAKRYFAVSADAIRTADPHHLYLGARFMGVPPLPVLRAASVVDAVSINLYVRDPRPAVSAVYAATDRPVLITEFAFRALDSGLPNTIGAGPWVFTERDRAQAYVRYVTRLESMPEVIGYHWFRWADEPAQGRGDGENSNYGLVDVHDRAYGGFVDAAAAANRAARAVHAGAAVSVAMPASFTWFRWTFGEAVNELLGGPRWVSTAAGALSTFMRHPRPPA